VGMLLLLGIGFLAGMVTAISPCVLPVLPILLAGGATDEEPRRPYAIVAGLAASFVVFTLTAAWLLDQLALPETFLRDLALALLFVLAASLLVPRLGLLLERPFVRLGRRSGRNLGGGFLLGASLGLVFVPCAGPVLTVITVSAASMDVGLETVGLTIAYALGAAVPMLAVAVGGQRAARALRPRAQQLRVAAGVLIAASALAIVFHLDTKAQTAIGDYTTYLQEKFERTPTAQKKLASLRGGAGGVARAASPLGSGLADFGEAPDFRGISHWLNTDGERPLSMQGLRGKVVLIDFWTYSCINCLRTLPHVTAWYERYRPSGLVVVGVHSPEFVFERDLSNVRGASKRLGVDYPVALDNGFETWNAYANQYWPAKYLIDRRGHVRYAHFGEGEYAKTERLIRRLLADRRGVRLPAAEPKADRTPRELVTPESYLGYQRLDRYAGLPVREDKLARYTFPRILPQNELAYAGEWLVGPERIVAGKRARLRLHFHASRVYLVLSGKGSVEKLVDGKRMGSVRVDGDRLYTLLELPRLADAVLELRFTPGLSAYAFTFG
ncbi:MAG: cytochrome c biogenesis protein DipZ, partial [Actinomycetota bacterium]|nr:cytochrome c biogenesis protein DipZ [Actinomycetota bacterium]